MLPFALGARVVILPCGLREVERTYVVPFARANCQDDYRTAWAFFESEETVTSSSAH